MNDFVDSGLKTNSGSSAYKINLQESLYDVVAIGEPISLDKVSTLGICTHAGFRIPNQDDIKSVLDMFPNLLKVEYNIIDSRIKDKSYWTERVADIRNNSDFQLGFRTIFFGDAYLSKIPLFKEYFEEAKSKYQNAFKELAKEEPQIVVFDTDLESGKHAYLGKETMQLLKNRASQRKEGRYDAADNIKNKLNGDGVEIIDEDKNNSRTVLKDYHKLNEQKRKIFDILETAYDASNMAELQTALHEGMFKDTIREYNFKRNSRISFERVNFISEERLADPDYDHILEDHYGQQAVLLPVLQGNGNGETEKHRVYVQDKYVKALEKNGASYDSPRIVISPKITRSMFSR